MVRALETAGAFPLTGIGWDLDLIAAVTAGGGIAIINYMDRSLGTDHYSPETYDRDNWGHYAVYLSHDAHYVQLLCNYRGVYAEPKDEFNRFWWDLLPDKTPNMNAAIIVFPDQASRQAGLANLRQFLLAHPKIINQLHFTYPPPQPFEKH